MIPYANNPSTKKGETNKPKPPSTFPTGAYYLLNKYNWYKINNLHYINIIYKKICISILGSWTGGEGDLWILVQLVAKGTRSWLMTERYRASILKNASVRLLLDRCLSGKENRQHKPPPVSHQSGSPLTIGNKIKNIFEVLCLQHKKAELAQSDTRDKEKYSLRAWQVRGFVNFNWVISSLSWSPTLQSLLSR